ncbi:hypothetical protein F5Y17DRAFT_204671 [Xylariaceae sp. FL0594]|nr:hypothetical protein F5Y17DRAFT_204671 [Xylariaceae sp. FL0594]
MPDDDMEMSVDYAHAGLVEDIDIDLDFPIAQPDADMVLEDFDQDLDSDTRDELMVEGDDSHYDMVDVIETDQNASAAAADDIDIELSHDVESIWQETAQHGDEDPAVEIDYLDEGGGEQMEDEEEGPQTGGSFHPLRTHGTDTMSEPKTPSAGVDLDPLQTHTEGFSPGSLSPVHEESPKQPNGPQSEAEGHSATAILDVEESAQADLSEHMAQEAQFAETTHELEEERLDDEQNDPYGNHTDNDGGGTTQHPDLSSKEDELSRLQGDVDSAVEPEPFAADGPLLSDATRPAPVLEESESVAVLEVSEFEEVGVDENQNEEENDQADPSRSDEVDQSTAGVDVSEDELGGETFVETTYDQPQPDEAPHHEFAELEHPYSPSEGSTLDENENAEGEGGDRGEGAVVNAATPSVGSGDRDDPVKLADRYGVFITYGRTNYSLFAKDEDDDPNDYFLSDKASLDLPLVQFLASLREVVSEEVSPLDELAMHVDGLGLEFSESTTTEFLGKFTFGDLVVLYDKLVQNEGAESSPPIYTSLTVRPNCNQRMRALTESANSGRGLSEVALYRGLSAEMDWASNADSPDTDLAFDDARDDKSDDELNTQEDLSDGGSGSDGAGRRTSPATSETQLTTSAPTVGSHHNEEQSDHYDDGDEDNGSEPLDSAPILHESEELATSDHDQPTDQAPTAPLQGTSSYTPEANNETDRTGSQEPHQSPAADSSLDVPNSQTTSVTITLGDEEEDEIDYDSDEDDEDIDEGHDATDGILPTEESPTANPDAKVSLDDEITWESDDEEGDEPTESASPKDTVQVSPVSRKRDQSEALGDMDDEGNDNKRRRS